MLEGEILQLPAQLRHSEAMGERCVEIARLCAIGASLRWQPVERPHVVEAVGDLTMMTRAPSDREKQLAVALDLPFFLRPAVGSLAILVNPSTIAATSLPNCARRRPS